MEIEQFREVDRDIFGKFQEEFEKLFGGQKQNIRAMEAKKAKNSASAYPEKVVQLMARRGTATLRKP